MYRNLKLELHMSAGQARAAVNILRRMMERCMETDGLDDDDFRVRTADIFLNMMEDELEWNTRTAQE